MSALKDIYDIIKELKGLVREYQNEEMSEKVIAIQEGFFDLRELIEDFKEENRNLREEICRLKDVSELERDLELSQRGYYIRISEKNEGKEIHYCPACWQNHKKLMPIVHTVGNAKQCCNCHTVIR